MDVFVLIQVRKFLVRRIGQVKPASPASRGAAIRAGIIPLTAISTPDEVAVALTLHVFVF
jgi:hypothetical protein